MCEWSIIVRCKLIKSIHINSQNKNYFRLLQSIVTFITIVRKLCYTDKLLLIDDVKSSGIRNSLRNIYNFPTLTAYIDESPRTHWQFHTMIFLSTPPVITRFWSTVAVTTVSEPSWQCKVDRKTAPCESQRLRFPRVSPTSKIVPIQLRVNGSSSSDVLYIRVLVCTSNTTIVISFAQDIMFFDSESNFVELILALWPLSV